MLHYLPPQTITGPDFYKYFFDFKVIFNNDRNSLNSSPSNKYVGGVDPREGLSAKASTPAFSESLSLRHSGQLEKGFNVL